MIDDNLFYDISVDSGEIRIKTDYYDQLQWQFQQVGIDIDTIKDEAQFRAAYNQSRDFVDAAWLRAIGTIKNPYAKSAFEALALEGDTEAFIRLGKRAEVYSFMKRNSTKNDWTGLRVIIR